MLRLFVVCQMAPPLATAELFVKVELASVKLPPLRMAPAFPIIAVLFVNVEFETVNVPAAVV